MPKKRPVYHKKEVVVKPREFDRKIKAPPSKSIMQRAVALGVLSECRTVISNPSFCEDSMVSLRIAGALGASVQFTVNKLIIEKIRDVSQTSINFFESGLAARMFMPVLGLYGKDFTLTAKNALLARPMGDTFQALRNMGLKIESEGDFLPARMSGNLQPGKVEIDSGSSSQTLTGLLMALPILPGDSEICSENTVSKPYIDLTIRMMEDFGVSVERDGYESFRIKGNRHYKSEEYCVENDWSSASFILAAGLIAGRAEVEGLSLESSQSDKKILEAIQLMEGSITITENSIITSKSNLKPFIFDASDCPDLFPPLVALAAYCKGTSVIKGTRRLVNKESNRAETLQSEFAKLGIKIMLLGDEMQVEGGTVCGGEIDSHNDHRIAMACAVAALAAEKSVVIHNADCVKKSYPNFFRDIGW